MKKLLVSTFFCICSLVGWAQDITFIERSWNGSTVVETEKTLTAGQYTVLDGTYPTPLESSSKDYELYAGRYYVVKDADVRYGMLTAPAYNPAHLIILDGAKLTAQIAIGPDAMLNIYGQTENSGKLVAKGEKWYARLKPVS